MFLVSIRHDSHVRRYSITPVKGSGWEAKLEEDQKLMRVARYGDWHKVERALMAFRLEVDQLTSRGWWEVPS
jgi:hypothetical protein